MPAIGPEAARGSDFPDASGVEWREKARGDGARGEQRIAKREWPREKAAMRKAPKAAVRRYCSGKVRASKGDSGGVAASKKQKKKKKKKKRKKKYTASRFT